MTKEENIATLNEHLEHWKRLLSEKICDQSEGEKTIDSLQNAIKVLEQEPCEDCVSREEVLWFVANYDLSMGQLVDAIHSLPPVIPQPKMGRWIRVDKDKLRCSECEVIHLIAQYPNGKIDYCPNCGRKMQESQESEDKE